MAMDIGPSTGKKGRAQPSMNVTPLVDVVLVLLIIFMVVTPMLAKQFTISVPDKPKEEEPPPDPSQKQPTTVYVTTAGEIMLNSNVIPKDQFAKRLEGHLRATQERTVFFDAANDAPFGAAILAMDLARVGGAATIAVAPEPLKK